MKKWLMMLVVMMIMSSAWGGTLTWQEVVSRGTLSAASIYIIPSGNGGVIMSGSNLGQLGTGDTTSTTTSFSNSSFINATQCDMTNDFIVCVMNDGTVKVAGINEQGNLGLGNTTSPIKTPSIVPGFTNVKFCTTGAYSGQNTRWTICMKNDGTVWGTGTNFHGELGDGTGVAKTSFVNISGFAGAIQCDAGRMETICLMGDGTVKGSGWNAFGGLGDGTTTIRLSPVVAMGGATNVKMCSNGSYDTMCVKNDGTVIFSGYNNYGVAGDGNTNVMNQALETVSNYFGAKSCYLGILNSYCIMSDGTVKAAGSNVQSQLGAVIASQYTPYTVPGMTNIQTCSLASTNDIACIDNNGNVYVTGSNLAGEFGKGVLVNNLTGQPAASLLSNFSPASSCSLGTDNGANLWMMCMSSVSTPLKKACDGTAPFGTNNGNMYVCLNGSWKQFTVL